MDIQRLAVVGMGGFARTHLRYVRQVEESGLGLHAAQVAIPRDQEQYAEEVEALRGRGVRVFASLRQMLAEARDELDIVCIPTGIPLHRPMTLMALEAGCHVLVEKPAAGCIQDVDAMLAAQTRAGKLCAVGYQHVYRPEYRRVKEWVCAGRLGKVRRIKAFGLWPRDPAYYGRNGWAGRLAVGDTWVLDSPHNNALAHAVNAMCFMACTRPGEALRPISVQAELYRANAIESADTAVFRARTEEGVEVFFAVSHCPEENQDPEYVVEGEKGRVALRYDGQIAVEWRGGEREECAAEPEGTQVLEDLVRVAGGAQRELACPLALTRAQTLCICGSFESAPIAELPASLKQVEGPGGRVVVRGMAAAVHRAWEEARLFSELGVPWARPGAEVDLADYAYFPTYRPEVGREER